MKANRVIVLKLPLIAAAVDLLYQSLGKWTGLAD